MAKYVIHAPRFIQQVGEPAPSFVDASPRHPVIVELPEGTHIKEVNGKKVTDPTLKPFKTEEDLAPAKHTHPGVKDGMPKSAAIYSEPVDEESKTEIATKPAKGK